MHPTDAASPRETVTAYFSALAQGQIAEAMAYLSPQVSWHQPGNNRFSGEHLGPEAVGALIGGMAEVSEGTFAVAPAGPLMANGDLVAAPVRFTGSRAGATLDMSGLDLLTVTDGLITEVRLFSEDGPAEDAFWGTERPVA